METPSKLTLAFSPNFGAVHWDVRSGGFLTNSKGSNIIRDENLAGRLVVFKPELPGAPPRTMFEIGRHPACWLKIGWAKEPYSGKFKEVIDEKGYPLMNYFPRISLTFQWMDASEWAWVGRSAWFIIPGGVFINKDGARERSGANLDVYLNGKTVSSEGNPEPLFPNGIGQVSIAVVNRDVHSKFDVPYEGKIIVMDRALGKHTTGWPAAVWEGPSWPVLPPPVELPPPPDALKENAEIEEAVAVQKMNSDSQGTLRERPWYAMHIEAAWAWYTAKGTFTQMVFLVLGSAGLALVLWAWSR